MKLIDTRAKDGKQKIKKSNTFISEQKLFHFLRTAIDENPDLVGNEYFKKDKDELKAKQQEE